MQTMTEKEAEEQGYRALTTRYALPKEKWMLDNVIADMKRGGIDFVLVSQPEGPEVWRRAPHAA